jgi:hypothetical protein
MIYKLIFNIMIFEENKEATLLSLPFNANNNANNDENANQFSEKTVYRSSQKCKHLFGFIFRTLRFS